LTLGKQRGYILYFSAPKQSKLEPLELSNTKVKF
jgi:hypothetical protein